MKPADPRREPPEALSDAPSGQNGRLAVSFLLFLHLFAVFIASLASARRVSGAIDRLYDRLVGPYAQLLNIGQYNLFHLTYALDSDSDHNCDVLVNWRPDMDDAVDEPKGVERVMLYDPRQTFPRLRERRYQMLALNVDLAANSGSASGTLLPRTVARTLLAENGITAGEHRFRCRVTNAPRPPWSNAPQPPPAINVYRANVVYQRGLAELVEVAPEAQVAPVDRRGSGDRATGPRLNVPPGAPNKPKPNADGDRK